MDEATTDDATMRARYERAERFCEWNVRAVVRNVTITPHPIDGERFWYARQVADGPDEIVVVDPDRASTTVVNEPPTTGPAVPAGHVRSPDGRRDLALVDGNLHLMPASDPTRTRPLTSGGDELDGWGTAPQSSTTWLDGHRAGLPTAPVAVWSPDGRRVLTHRLDQRQVPETPLVEMRPADGHRPRLWTYRMPFVGDELATAALVVIDVGDAVEGDTGEGDTAPPIVTPLDTAPLLVEFASPIELGWVWWSDDSSQIWFLREARGAKALELCVADAATGVVRSVLTESSDEYVEPHPLLPWPSSVRLLPGGTHLVWPSERTGWRHLSLVDIATGEVVRALTEGEWAVREVLAVDDDWVWFSACGREPGRDPYRRHVYRAPIAGGEPELLTPEDADHAVTMSPGGGFLIDTWSTIDTAPVTTLRRADGTSSLVLEVADLSALHDLGWRPPERFSALAADGVTELHGVLYLPTDFDPDRRYPVVDSWYPGPQLIRTPQCFTVDDDSGVDAWPGPWGAQAMAELGVVVVNIDGHGTPLRSRAFHHATYGRLQDHAIDDHLAVLDELATTRPWMDVGRLGAQGHSGGAAATVRAMLARPDRFHVGISGSGVHDLRRYVAYWGEKYHGLPAEVDYEAQSNESLADQLAGHLLLLHGELDDNVHPSNTLALYDAFVRADKDVDLVILGGESHPCWRHPFYVRRSWDHVVRHLLGEAPPRGYRVTPPPPAAAGPGW